MLSILLRTTVVSMVLLTATTAAPTLASASVPLGPSAWTGFDETILAHGFPTARLADIRWAQNLASVEGDALERAIGVTKIATARQARDLGLDPVSAPPIVRSPSLLAAFSVLASRFDTTLDAATSASLGRLRRLPLRTRMTLTAVVDAFVALDEAAETAYAGRPPDAPDLGGVFAARDGFLDAVLAFSKAWSKHGRGTADVEPMVVPPLFALDLEGENSEYVDDVALSIDVGGDDFYRNNAGGNNILDGGCSSDPTDRRPGAAALLDLAGDDRYGDPAAPRRCGVNGGAFIGAGVLIDVEGNDHYVAAGTGANGGAQGAGLLIDAAGDDTYLAGSGNSSNGGSGVGAGLLVDGGGDDVYEAGTLGTNGGGYAAGTGMLIDLEGNDIYRARGEATNGGGFLGGRGHLVDLEGNDVYSAWGTATNGGASAGIGFLYDGSGDDTYTAESFGTNGGAYGGGSGLLFDEAGDDVYTAGGLGTNGGGHSGGAGALVDGSGSDRYTATHLGANGGGAEGGKGFLFDFSGDDVYTATWGGVNGGGNEGVGLLVDLGGRDLYEDEDDGSGVDRTVVPKGTAGAQIDHADP